MANERDLTNAENLAANQAGTLTEAQRREAARLAGWPGCFSTLVVGLMIVMGALLALAFRIALDPNSALGLEPTSSLGAVVVPTLILALAWTPAVLYTLRISVRRMLTRQDLTAGDLQQGEGAVVWRTFRHIYLIDLPARPRWHGRRVTRLAPGPYQFYYLPRSGYVLSAQALAARQAPMRLNEALQQVLKFTAGELDHNRAGILSPGQRRRLIGQLVGAGLMIVFIGAYLAGQLATPGNSWIFTAMTAVVLVALVVESRGPLRDLLGGQISQAEGLGTRTTGGDGRAYWLKVGDENLRVTMWVYHAIVPGQTYRAYFTPHTRQLLALECVGVSDISADTQAAPR